MDTDADREARRVHRRATMQIRVTTLQDDVGANGLWGATTPAERLALADELSRSGWLLSGRPVPDYDRADMPVRIFTRNATAV